MNIFKEIIKVKNVKLYKRDRECYRSLYKIELFLGKSFSRKVFWKKLLFELDFVG